MAENDSASGGYIKPAAEPAPIDGQELNRFVQAWLVGVSGLAGEMVRPSYQSEPPNIPSEGDAWMAFRYISRPSDTFPYIGHSDDGDTLRRNEEVTILCSFYDLGTNGLADYYATITKDNASIPQNVEPLKEQNFGLVAIGEATPVPVLVKQRWMYRIDMEIDLRRQILRTYPVESLVSAEVVLDADSGGVLIERVIDIQSPEG